MTGSPKRGTAMPPGTAGGQAGTAGPQKLTAPSVGEISTRAILKEPTAMAARVQGKTAARPQVHRA